MSCVYFYKGNLIGNIKDLDTFLIEKQRFHSTLGDIVFSNPTRLNNAINRLKPAEQKSKELQKQYNEAKEKAKREHSYIDGEEHLVFERPYVGVNDFLSGQRNSITGNLYFPEFKKEEYWSRRFYEWAKGGVDNFTEDEIALFFDGDKDKVTAITLGNPNDWRESNGVYKKEFGTDEQKRLRKLMEDKWEHQSKYGTEIHNVLQQYFSKTKDGKMRYELWEDSKTGKMQLENSINYLINSNLISEDLAKKDANGERTKINQILAYAKNLRETLEQKYGRNDDGSISLAYYPEFTLTADLNKDYVDDNGQHMTKILGRSDLIIIDKSGYPHIIDYKTSPKPYDQYSSSKQLGFTYQLATYERMLRRWGLNTTKTDIVVAPIVLEGFRKENDQWVYDNVVQGSTSQYPLESLNDKANETYVNNNLDDFIEAPLVIDGTSEDIIEKVSKTFTKWFPKYRDNKSKSDDEIRNLIEEHHGFDLNELTGNYEFTPVGSNKPIIATAMEGENALFERVKSYYVSNKERVVKNTKGIIDAIKKGQEENTDQIQFPKGTDDWVRLKVSKYCNNHWEVLEDSVASDAALQYGMILLYNKELDLMDVVKISGQSLKYIDNSELKDTNLSRAFESDNVEDSKSNTLILKAANGNIELMETMLVLNNLKFNKPINIGKMQVISPFGNDAQGLSASNNELKYNWNKLIQVSTKNPSDADIQEDNFNNGSIKLLSKTEQCYLEFKEILENRLDPTNLGSRYQPLKPLSDTLYGSMQVKDREGALLALNNLRKSLEESFVLNKDIDRKGDNYHSKLESYDSQYAKTLYQQVSQAILDLNNFEVRQTLKDHDNYLESAHILSKGLSGNMLDNAGNFGNELLNKITAITLEGYQNGRDSAYPKLVELRKRTEELKKHVGYNRFIEHTIGNQTSMYDGMTEYTQNGDLMFINPWLNPKGLNAAQVDYLKYVILQVNKFRHPTLSEEEIQDKIKTNDVDFFRMPLVKASFASKVHTDGWLTWMKNKFKAFTSWKNFKDSVGDTTSEFFSEQDEENSKLNTEIFEAINIMDQGYGNDRLEKIQEQRTKFGDGYYERDLEAILSTLTWSYSTANALQDRMPLLKAAYISLAVMGNDQNYSFKHDEQFIKDFVDNRINYRQIDDPKLRTLKGIINQVQKAASWMALAFSPIQFSYQMLEGIWKDAKLIITKPDGTEAFTFQNMKSAAKTIYQELFHYSDKPSVSMAVNALYGINDMDKAAFAENNTSNNHGIFNFFGKFAYRFSSRPDFYNRMTIFAAQMMKDGNWKAHKINPKTNQLEYNWKEDERFKAYATDNKHDMEAYNKSKALYFATAQQLVREGARNADGSLFTLGEKVALPKAYSNKEAEAKKAVGDTMYGYYDSTKKSMMQATLLGGLLMQMRTYWSAKKNQYLAPGGIKAQGEWVQATDDKGEKLYYAVTETGEIDKTKMPVAKSDPSSSDIPFMQWKGKFEEGVLLTLWDLGRECWEQRSFKEGWNNKMHNPNTDPDVIKAYKSNLKLLVTDLAMWILIGSAALLLGDWTDDEEKKFKESGNFDDALSATFAGLVSKTVKNSSLDFAWWEAIFNVSMDWNPFSLSYVAREAQNLMNLAVGDDTMGDTLVKSFSAARQVKPLFEFIGQEE